MDFYEIMVKDGRSDSKKSVRPSFLSIKSKDIFIKGGEFYAVWDEENGIWSNSIYDLNRIIDDDVGKYCSKMRDLHPTKTYAHEKMVNNSTKLLDEFVKWCKLQPNNFKPINCKVKFANDKINKTDYCTFRLPYSIEPGPMDAYEEIMQTLYLPEEREKIEWAIGSIIVGDSKKIQKAIALYGGPGTGKSTVLKIITKMFTANKVDKYVGTISTKNLVKQNDNFSAAPLKEYKLVLIDNDANLMHIDDNATLNTIISHEPTRANSKYGKDEIVETPVGMLFLATNSYIGMTDAKSGLKRRFIVVEPTGTLVEADRYDKLMKEINNELGAIAYHCREVYLSMGISAYDNYVPNMMYEYSNPIYSWLSDTYEFEIKKLYPNGMPLNNAWELFVKYCEDSGLKAGKKSDFKIDMYEYFSVKENVNIEGRRHRYFYYGLKEEKFKNKPVILKPVSNWLNLNNDYSVLDKILGNCPAQYEVKSKDGTNRPQYKWENVKTTLKDILTYKIHYVKVPLNHIVIDFDLKDEFGNKSLELNLEAAKQWPVTYAELSKSGCGLHLHYIYDGDPLELKRIYDDNIEIKVFNGDSGLRRRVSKCNDLPLEHLTVGDLPLKEKKVYNAEGFKSEETLRDFINACLRKEHHGATTPEVHFIKKALDDMYESGKPYNVSDMKQEIIVFASHSHNQAEQCLKLVTQMQWCSKDSDEEDYIIDDSPEYEEAPIAFFDIEVFPNLLVICWKVLGDPKINRMINPEPIIVWKLFCTNKYRWVGFNNRGYDNHIIKAWANGDRTNYDLFVQSKRIINDKDQDAKLLDAYNISYTDILDYSKEKMSLKKWEIKLGIHHQELGLSWDQPVPEELWAKVAEYCDNDVIATEAVWNATQADFAARKILAEIAGGTPNMSTNKLSCMFVFENNKNPQSEFNYRFMGEPEPGHTYTVEDDGITAWQDDGKPIFLGYKYEYGKSSYLDVDVVGEGGYVYAEVGNNKVKVDDSGGIYYNVVTFDVASMHPSSMIMENLFGDYYTNRFKEIVDLRLAIKHREFDKARKMFGGKLAKYLENEEMADGLAGALKIVINAFYGMTSSKKTKFICTDERNVDNIVAKRGSLFMINLRNLVQRMGYTVVHCKTDSIKVENPDEFISNFIVDYGKKFGYNFEIEHKFEKICLVNDAVYIGLLAKDDPDWVKDCKKAAAEGKPQPTRWTATGTEFAVPYVYKSLFSHEAITYDDLVETKTVQTGDIYLDFNENLKDVTFYEAIKETRRKINDGIKTTNKARDIAAEYNDMTEDQLDALIAEGHEYHFVGRVGAFSPVIDGVGGGIMLRRNEEGKHFAVTGTKGYRWLEVETIKELGLENKIDMSYYENLANDAIAHVEQYGSFEEFVTF